MDRNGIVIACWVCAIAMEFRHRPRTMHRIIHRKPVRCEPKNGEAICGVVRQQGVLQRGRWGDGRSADL